MKECLLCAAAQDNHVVTFIIDNNTAGDLPCTRMAEHKPVVDFFLPQKLFRPVKPGSALNMSYQGDFSSRAAGRYGYVGSLRAVYPQAAPFLPPEEAYGRGFLRR
mgnify:CR=1 FL=1